MTCGRMTISDVEFDQRCVDLLWLGYYIVMLMLTYKQHFTVLLELIISCIINAPSLLNTCFHNEMSILNERKKRLGTFQLILTICSYLIYLYDIMNRFKFS